MSNEPRSPHACDHLLFTRWSQGPDDLYPDPNGRIRICSNPACMLVTDNHGRWPWLSECAHERGTVYERYCPATFSCPAESLHTIVCDDCQKRWQAEYEDAPEGMVIRDPYGRIWP